MTDSLLKPSLSPGLEVFSMCKNVVRLIIGVAAGLFCLISASTASAGAFNVNCARIPANGVINRPGDDVTLACNLAAPKVTIIGLSITVTPAGSITTRMA